MEEDPSKVPYAINRAVLLIAKSRDYNFIRSVKVASLSTSSSTVISPTKRSD